MVTLIVGLVIGGAIGWAIRDNQAKVEAAAKAVEDAVVVEAKKIDPKL